MRIDYSDYDLDIFLSTSDLQLIETDNFKSIVELCEGCARHKQLGVITGDQGFGITTALKYTTSQLKRKSMHHELLADSGIRPLLLAFMDEIEYRNSPYLYKDSNSSDLIRSINYQLQTKTLNKYLISVDDIGHLKRLQINTLAEFIDKAYGHTGLVLSITPRKMLALEKSAKREIMPAKILDTIDHPLKLLPPTKEDMRAICFENGVINDRVIDEIVSECQNLRQLTSKLLRLKKHVRARLEGNDT